MDSPQRPAPPPPAPRRPPPGPPPGPDTGEVLQQIMAITDQSLEEAQARCCAGSMGAGPPKVAAEKGAGPGARAKLAGGPRGEGGCVCGRGAGRGDVGARGGLKGVSEAEEIYEVKCDGLKGLWGKQRVMGFRGPSWGERNGFKGSVWMGRCMVKGGFGVYGM